MCIYYYIIWSILSLLSSKQLRMDEILDAHVLKQPIFYLLEKPMPFLRFFSV
jgi:hypothetical protein